MNYARFPMTTMRFSSLYNSRGHLPCSTGSPKDYPTDLVGNSSTDRMWMYNTFGSDLLVLRKYTKASHSIWLRTVDKVQTPIGVGYLYAMIEHQDNAEMKPVGAVYKMGSKVVREGKNGRASGFHLHCSFGFSTEKRPVGSGWKRNSKGAWVLNISGVKNIKIEDAFFIDKNFTHTIKDTRLKFKRMPSGNPVEPIPEPTPVKIPTYKIGETYTLQENMNVRIGHSASSARVSYSKLSQDAKKHSTPDGKLKKGTKVTVKDVYKSGISCWVKTPSGWICGYSGDKVYIK